MLSRRSDRLLELIRDEHKSLKELIRDEHKSLKELIRSQQEATRREWEATREFNREILLRNEKVYTAMIVQLEENTKQTRANTQAVLSMLDRFDGSGGLAA